MQVSLLSFEEFHRLEAEWDELAASTAAPLPFMTHAWLRVWWGHFGGHSEFLALAVRSNGRLLAGVPLGLRRVRLAGLRLTVGEIAGTAPVPTRGMGLADKTDLLVRRDDPAALEPLCRELLRLLERVDLLHFKGFDVDLPALGLLRVPGSHLLDRSVSPYVRLEGWERYLESRSGNFKKHLRKSWRQLEQAGPLRVERLNNAGELEPLLAEALEVNRASWKAGRGTNLFRHPRVRGFMLDLIRALAARGALDLHVLRLGERAAAYELCFDFAGRVFSYNSAFREEFRRLSPGTALTAAVIQAACERGCNEYDLLRGGEKHKQRWNTGERQECELLLPGPRLAARIYTALGPRLKHRLKEERWIRVLADRAWGFATRLVYR